MEIDRVGDGDGDGDGDGEDEQIDEIIINSSKDFENTTDIL